MPSNLVPLGTCAACCCAVRVVPCLLVRSLPLPSLPDAARAGRSREGEGHSGSTERCDGHADRKRTTQGERTRQHREKEKEHRRRRGNDEGQAGLTATNPTHLSDSTRRIPRRSTRTTDTAAIQIHCTRIHTHSMASASAAAASTPSAAAATTVAPSSDLLDRALAEEAASISHQHPNDARLAHKGQYTGSTPQQKGWRRAQRENTEKGLRGRWRD